MSKCDECVHDDGSSFEICCVCIHNPNYQSGFKQKEVSAFKKWIKTQKNFPISDVFKKEGWNAAIEEVKKFPIIFLGGHDKYRERLEELKED